MSIQVACPSCSGTFKAADSAAGKKAKCPKCAGVIEIPGGEPAEEILDAEDALPRSFDDHDFEAEPAQQSLAASDDRKPCPMCGEMIQRNAVKCRYCGEVFDRSMVGILGGRAADMRDPRWKKVRTGLATLYYSMIIMVLTIILMVVVGATLGGMNAAGPNADPPAAMLIMSGLCGLVVLGVGIAVLVGYALCANVPEVSGARGFVVGSIVCLLANTLLAMIGGATQVEALNLLGSVVSVAGSILFILYLRTTAGYLGNGDLATSATRLIIFGFLFLAGAFVMGILAGIGQAPALMGVIGLAVAIGGLVVFVWYVNLIKGLMTTIDQRTGAF